MKTYICENCGKEHDGSYGSGRFCCKHCRCSWIGKHVNVNGNHKCNFHLKSGKHSKKPYGTWTCKYCGLVFEVRAELDSHRRSLHPIQPGSSWNKGLTKETDDRVRQYAETNKRRIESGEIIPHMRGKHRSEETKKKLSLAMKNYLKEHPDKVPYLLNHSSKESYPEQFFRNAFTNEQYPKFEQNKYIEGHFLDFAFEQYKVYVEIDGEQHFVQPKIVEHDKIRTETLNATEWKCILRIRWSKFQKLTNEQKHKFIIGLKQKILNCLMV